MIPTLIHPILIQLAQIDRDSSIYDDSAREVIGNIATETVTTLQAQVSFKQIDKPDPQYSGVREKSLGYLLFRFLDLGTASITLKRGDRIRKIGNRNVNYFLHYFQDCGHYPDQGGATLVKAYFVDRHPSSQEGDL